MAVTASAMVGDRERIAAAGFDGYIQKPIDPETFIDEVELFIPSELISEQDRWVQDELGPRRRRPGTDRELLATVLRIRRLHRLGGVQRRGGASSSPATDRPDLVFTDILMPNMDGYDSCGSCAATRRSRDTRVIFCTATYARRRSPPRRGLRRVEILVKPCEPEEILRVVAAALARMEPRDERPPRSGARTSTR